MDNYEEITINLVEEVMPNAGTIEVMEQSSAFSFKVKRLMMETQFHHESAFFGNKMVYNLVEKLNKSSVCDIQFCGSEKMRQLMKMQFSSPSDDMLFCESMVRIMYYELYKVVCDKNVNRFVFILELVCKENRVDLATIFNHVTPTGDSLLHVAAQHGSEQVLCLIAFHYPNLLYKTNLNGDTPLHLAARAKNVVAVKNILDMDKYFMESSEEEAHQSVDDKEEFIMLRNNYGMTALHEAILCKDYHVVLYLLFAHKQLDDLTIYWTWNYHYGCKSPMYLAVLSRDEDIIDLLLRAIPIPAGMAISNGDSPLHAAILERNKDLLMKIVHTRQELLYQRDDNNNTPLHYAAYSGYMEGVCIMLEKSPMSAFQRNMDGNLPIHLACKKGNVAMVKKLLEIKWSNAGIFFNNQGQSILHIAAMKGQTDMIKYLLKHPKIHHDIVNERDINGDTPLHLASRELRLWTLLLLSRDKMIDVNIVNNHGFTARDVVRMKCRNPMTRQEFLADTILEKASVPLKANMLGIQHTTSTNKEWNVKEAANTLIILAILIATVTFTAGFTVPGGFYSSDGSISKQRGMALLADQTLFKIFIAFNTIAMYSSIIGSVILLWVPLGDLHFAEGAYGLAKMFVYVALIAMPISFQAAISLIVSNNTLVTIITSVIGFISIIFIIFFRVLGTFPLRTRRPVFRQIADLLIRIIIVLFYGWSDSVLSSDQVGKVNQVNQVDARNQMNNEAFAIDIDDAASSHFSDTNVHRCCRPCFAP